jgi:GMP synthase-like glutamine amidotransferase
MRVHVLQHVPFEDIGSMAFWLAARNSRVTYTRFHESLALPEPGGLDLVLVMGGPMSVNDNAAFPWLKAEKQFVREVIQRGVPIVGICLGAQLIASALGARVYRNPEKEIGWFDIEGLATGESSFRFPQRATVFHWHGETFDLPAGAACLARSAACENQAFQVGTHVLGLQFHLETTPQSLDALINNCRDEIVESTYVQGEAAMRDIPKNTFNEINGLLDEVLSHLTRS